MDANDPLLDPPLFPDRSWVDELRSGGIGMNWSVSYRRAGGIDGEYGGCSGYSTPEDAAYACLSTIEQAEREAYLENLVVGVA